MRLALVACAAAGCGFTIPGAGVMDAPADAAGDAREIDAVAVDAPPPSPCAADPALELCFSFDAPALASPLPDEVAGTQPATLANITRIERVPGNGAAQFGGTSSMRVPMDPQVTGVLSLELVFRADAIPTTRAGLVDSNTSSNISLFLHPASAGFTLRCGLGNQTENWLATVTPAQWHHVACVCDAGALTLYFDGVAQMARSGSCGGGAIVGDGFTIGSNNTGNAATFDDRLTGALDYVRLWSVPRTASEIAAAATAAAGP